jgi:hypothetical protein
VLAEHGEDDMAGAVAGGVDAGAPKVKASMAALGGDASSTGARGGKGPSWAYYWGKDFQDGAGYMQPREHLAGC